MLRVVGKPGHLEVHQADRHLSGRDPDPEHLRPAGGDMLELSDVSAFGTN